MGKARVSSLDIARADKESKERRSEKPAAKRELEADYERKIRFLTMALDSANKQLVCAAADVGASMRRVAELEKRLDTAGAGRAEGLAAVDRLASGVAHEINTPLQYVSDSVQFLKGAFTDVMLLVTAVKRASEALRAAGDVETADALDEAWAAADADYLVGEVPRAFYRTFDGIGRIAGIITAVRTFAHPKRNARAPADLNEALANTLVVARNEYKYVADIETDFRPLPPVWCRLGELNLVFLSLIVRASQGMTARGERRGTIALRTRLDGAWVIVEVEDKGPTSKEPARARSDADDDAETRRASENLALARSVVAGHRGTLTVNAQRGRGTTWSIRLPVGGT